MKVFLDTNIVIDLLGCRQPFFEDAARIASMGYRGEIEIVVSTISYPTISYILQKYSSIQEAIHKLDQFASFTTIAMTSDTMIKAAFKSPITDYEDAVQHETALGYSCDVIVTRNVKDFKNATIKVCSPAEFLSNFS